MLIWLVWSVGGIAVINIVALVALCVAYTWHHGLKLVREERRHARQQPFERLLPPAMGGGRITPRARSRRAAWFTWTRNWFDGLR